MLPYTIIFIYRFLILARVIEKEMARLDMGAEDARNHRRDIAETGQQRKLFFVRVDDTVMHVPVKLLEQARQLLAAFAYDTFECGAGDIEIARAILDNGAINQALAYAGAKMEWSQECQRIIYTNAISPRRHHWPPLPLQNHTIPRNLEEVSCRLSCRSRPCHQRTRGTGAHRTTTGHRPGSAAAHTR